MSPIAIKMWTKPILSLDLTGGGVPESSPQPDDDFTYFTYQSNRMTRTVDDVVYFLGRLNDG